MVDSKLAKYLTTAVDTIDHAMQESSYGTSAHMIGACVQALAMAELTNEVKKLNDELNNLAEITACID